MLKDELQLLPPSLTNKQAIVLLKRISEVTILIGELKRECQYYPIDKHLLSFFCLSEAIHSTRIEGSKVSFSDLLEKPLEIRKQQEIQEVINYQLALTEGVKLIKEDSPFSTRMITSLHEILMMGNARGTNSSGGEYRKVQNFIGPDKNIEHTVYIPVSANKIASYMENLEFYVNETKHSSFIEYDDDDLFVIDETAHPLFKLAIMHAQFESIHPFLDGNGRLGRILIALMAIKYGLVDIPVFLVSEELEKERLRYYDLLNGVRGKNPD